MRGGPLAPLSFEEVEPGLRTRALGRRLHAYRILDSTNDLFRTEPFRSAPPGTVVVAEEQRKGRGRFDRAWVAPPFRALLFSVLLEAEGGAERAALVGLVAALAVAEAVAVDGGPALRIRWPNDLVGPPSCTGKPPDPPGSAPKVAGILSEYSEPRRSLVIGIGLNVNQEEGELPPGAASLRTLSGRAIARGPLLAEILNRLEGEIDALLRDGFEPLRARIEARSSLAGRTVTVDLGRERLTAAVQGIGPRGGLLLRTETGPTELLAGEVVRILLARRDTLSP